MKSLIQATIRDLKLEYAKTLVRAAEAIGIRGHRLVHVAQLARETAWLVGIARRGSDPRAVASAALYWLWLLDYLRGRLPTPPLPARAWTYTNSSRPSFYRAIRIWAHYILRCKTHRPLLALRVTMRKPQEKTHIIGVVRDAYSVACIAQDCKNRDNIELVYVRDCDSPTMLSPGTTKSTERGGGLANG